MAEKGYNTKIRRILEDYLQSNAHSTVTAGEVLRHFEALGEPVSRTTVYRNLDRMVEERSVIKYVSDDGKKASYLYRESHINCEDHLHLQCSLCGKVIHLDCHFMAELMEHIRASHGFALKCDSSILYGLCADCKKQQN